MNYFNANQWLPQDVIEQVLAHLPPGRRERALVYFQTDYYAARDAAVVQAFEEAVRAGSYGTLTELYEALAERFCLSPRRIWTIVRRGGPQDGLAHREPRRVEAPRRQPARPASVREEVGEPLRRVRRVRRRSYPSPGRVGGRLRGPRREGGPRR